MIYLSSELPKKDITDLDFLLVEKYSLKILKFLSIKKDLSVTFVDDKRMQQINKEFRNVNSVTDVLSFSQNEGIFGDSTILGDVVISYHQAKRQAPLSNNNTQDEIIYLIIHSILHLIGYDHYTKNEEVIMRKKEKEIFSFILDKTKVNKNFS